jgi:signal transduction histidine kinase
MFLCYYFFIPYRLIIENRRSWEYYQKNKLLSQVEELKTNFISMMSHDLKTPIARIQGMSDVIISDGVALSSQQREAVDTIKHSADDLLKFITAILNYGKIESQGVQLHLQSKDINNLLQEVIRKHEFLAKVKRIQIVSELEPMFPVPVDAELMKQVFSNLVENAIKYSPEDTKIMVSSEETDTKVVVQVVDQGPGIPAEELQNIFMKFFRSKNAKSSPIKGSGLGLYLAKYFTELHHGVIFVESSHGQGSTFTVELPMEQGGSHA